MSRPINLIAFDPGERTGFVEATFDKDDLSTFQLGAQGVLTVNLVIANLAGLIKPNRTVVYETWRLYENYAHAMIGNDMQPSQVVGMIRYVATKQHKKLVSQGATVKATAIATMPDWLKAHMNLSSEQHDKDAIMHAWHYAWRRHHGH